MSLYTDILHDQPNPPLHMTCPTHHTTPPLGDPPNLPLGMTYPPQPTLADTMQEEAEQVTRKLRKLWVKYTKAQGELDGAWGEWAGEKEEMLDSVRMLQQQLTLKDLVIQAFVPPEDVQKVPPTFICVPQQSPRLVTPDGDPLPHTRAWGPG